MSRSRDLFHRARQVTPGGVHSPVRSLAGVGMEPIFIRSARGTRITDVDGRVFTDYCMAFGPLIHGHGDQGVRQAVKKVLADGWSYGTAESLSLELAEALVERVGWIDAVRFVNSGTEAVMTALRLARAATGRDLVVKFEGCYHGHSDGMLVKAGSGLAAMSEASSAGISCGVAADTAVLPLDDENALEALVSERGDQLAAVIIEPLPANHGLLPQRKAFLQALLDRARSAGALVIFDEVITGFRTGLEGVSGEIDLTPDLVTWGKIIGGGFPVGAVAGPRETMELLAPAGPVYQAGTLSANPVAMAAGLTTLQSLDDQVYAHLDGLGARLESGLKGLQGLSLQRHGSIFWLCPAAHQGVIRTTHGVPPQGVGAYPDLFRAALSQGVYLPPSPWEVGFLSTAHTEEDIDRLAEVIRLVS